MNTYDKKDQLQSQDVTGTPQVGVANPAQSENAFMPNQAAGWSSQMKDIMQQINDRKPFQFDLNGDALYQQYKNQYTNLGKLAMQDTMGQAAGLTGGYGNTYAQNAGQQAYNAYLDKLNGIIPDIYAQQRSAYDAEGDRLYDQFNLANAMYGNANAAEQQEYERAWNEEQRGYERQQQALADANDKIMALIQMGITPSADDIAASSYSVDEVAAMKKWIANQQAGGSGSGGGGRSGGGGSSYRGSSSGSGNGGNTGYKYTTGELQSLYAKAQDGGLSKSALASYVSDYAKKNGMTTEEVYKFLASSDEPYVTKPSDSSWSNSGIGGLPWALHQPINNNGVW